MQAAGGGSAALCLKTNHLTQPLDMDAGTLLLSWQCVGGVRQTAFEIEATAGAKTLWTSGKTLSSVMRTDTPTPVPPRTRGQWRIRRWKLPAKGRRSLISPAASGRFPSSLALLPAIVSAQSFDRSPEKHLWCSGKNKAGQPHASAATKPGATNDGGLFPQVPPR